MLSLRTLWLSIIVLALVTAPSIGYTGLAGSATGSAQSDHVITSCQTIDEPGRYVLESDIDAKNLSGHGDACILVKADDVVIDGQGHTLHKTQTFEEKSPIPEGIMVDGASNVTVRDITLTDWWKGVVTGGPGLTVVNVTARNNAIGVDARTDNSVIEDSRFVHNQHGKSSFGFGVRLAGDGNRLVNSTFRNNTRSVEVTDGNDILIQGNTFSNQTDEPADGATPYALRVNQVSNATITNNEFSVPPKERWDGIILESRKDGSGSIVFANNTVRGTSVVVAANHTVVEHNRITPRDSTLSAIHTKSRLTNVSIRGNHLWNSSEGVLVEHTAANSDALRIEHNTITGTYRAVVVDSAVPVNITDNDLTGNNVGVDVQTRHEDRLVEIHSNDLANNSAFGVDTPGVEVPVNATNNYWGGDGPGSKYGDECRVRGDPLEDPVTGALADGNGSYVSEGQTTGEAGSHFDPWLDAPPEDAGAPDWVINGTAA